MIDVPSSAAAPVVLVTGATGGIGLEAARALVARGYHVVVGARDVARGRAIVDEFAASGRADLLEIDVASQASIRAAVAALGERFAALDVLVNNAGIVAGPRTTSVDGFELTWATNVLGPFLLAQLLVPLLRRAPQPRVVNVSSAAHRAGRLAWDDLQLMRGYSGWRAYAQSKLALNLLTREFARREPGIAANAVHPGAIATGIWRAAPAPVRAVLGLALPPAGRGAEPVVHLAADPIGAVASGRYFERSRDVEPSPASRDDVAAARLWDIVAGMTAEPAAHPV